MAATLHPLHVARLQVAAACASRAGDLRLDGDGDTAFLVWYELRMGRNVRHVIANGSERGLRALLPVAQAELERAISNLNGARGQSVEA